MIKREILFLRKKNLENRHENFTESTNPTSKKRKPKREWNKPRNRTTLTTQCRKSWWKLLNTSKRQRRLLALCWWRNQRPKFSFNNDKFNIFVSCNFRPTRNISNTTHQNFGDQKALTCFERQWWLKERVPWLLQQENLIQWVLDLLFLSVFVLAQTSCFHTCRTGLLPICDFLCKRQLNTNYEESINHL